MKKIVVSSILPGLFLSIANIVTIVLVYAICSMVGGFLQPVIFVTLALSLAALNVAVLCFSRITKRFGRKTAHAKAAATVVYYLATLGFTLATFLWIDVQWYAAVALLAIVLYLCVCSGIMLYFRGRNQETKAQQDEEAAKVRLLLLPIADEIRESRKWLEPALYYRLSRQFGAVEHRLSRATSFDRRHRSGGGADLYKAVGDAGGSAPPVSHNGHGGIGENDSVSFGGNRISGQKQGNHPGRNQYVVEVSFAA